MSLCVSVLPSLTDLAEAITLRFGSDMFTLTIWPALCASQSHVADPQRGH